MVDVGSELINAFDGSRLRLGKALGSGGEGTVFLAHDIGDPETPLAIKWYHTRTVAPSQRERLETLVSTAPPSRRFLWPEALVRDPKSPDQLGYVMPFRPEGFVGFNAVIDGATEPMSFATLATVARNLADSFHALHAQGLCYRDIKDANIFARPSDGEVLICDNDNVSVDGGEVAGVRGSLYFMAPEVMRGEANPSRDSDLFSLAVLLFYLFVHHNPLDGRRCSAWDAEGQEQALAINPLFIFDPMDPSNRPDPVSQEPPLLWWPLLPTYVQDLFTTTFTKGLHDSKSRTAETVWRAAFDDLRASEITCSCGLYNLYDPSKSEQRCWGPECSRPLPSLPTMIPARPHGHRPLQLNIGATLTDVNCSKSLGTDHSRVLGVVEGDPADPAARGLRNVSAQAWTFREDAGSSELVLEPGRALRVRNGLLDFGNGYSARLQVAAADGTVAEGTT